MKIPKKIKIGNKEYNIKKTNFYFNDTLGGQINYNTDTIKIKNGNQEEITFFHEIAHGILKELEFNYPKMVAFRNNESFTHELGLTLMSTFLDLLKKQEDLK